MDLYDLLGVERGASEAEVRRAYQKRARVLHPHLNPGDPEAAQRFAEVASAFGVLSDPKRREAYDRGERPELAQLCAQGSFEGFDFSAGARLERVGFREIFDAVLHPAKGMEQRAPGEDLEQRTRLTFEEALRGAERRLQVGRHEACPACRGAGELAADPLPCQSIARCPVPDTGRPIPLAPRLLYETRPVGRMTMRQITESNWCKGSLVA